MYKEDLLDKDLKLEYILLKFLYLSTGHIKKSDADDGLQKNGQ